MLISGRIQNAEKGKKSVGFRREKSAGLVPRREDVTRKTEGKLSRRLVEEGVRKTTHAGQTVSKTVAEEKCVKCVTTQRLCIDPQCVKDGRYSKLWLQSSTTSPCRHLRRRQDHHAGRLNFRGVAAQ